MAEDLSKKANDSAKGPAPYRKARLEEALKRIDERKRRVAAAKANGGNAEIIPFERH